MPSRTQLCRALSKAGHCSRKQAQRYITFGLVSVNGKKVHDPFSWVDTETDILTLDHSCKPDNIPSESGLHNATKKINTYLLLYKPRGFVTTRSDELGRKTVYDLLPEKWKNQYLFPVGRLDKDSEGLLIMTNDGNLLQTLTDPENMRDKTYRVLLKRFPTQSDLDKLESGSMKMDGKRLLPLKISHDHGRWYIVILHEGKNRQIRRMFHSLGIKVERLIRTSIGPVTAISLNPGETRELTEKEVTQLLTTKG